MDPRLYWAAALPWSARRRHAATPAFLQSPASSEHAVIAAPITSSNAAVANHRRIGPSWAQRNRRATAESYVSVGGVSAHGLDAEDAAARSLANSQLPNTAENTDSF